MSPGQAGFENPVSAPFPRVPTRGNASAPSGLEARNPEHVPGIYNRCDRWCERCPDRSKCLVFAMEQEMAVSVGGADNESGLLKAIGKSMDLAHELLDRSHAGRRAGSGGGFRLWP